MTNKTKPENAVGNAYLARSGTQPMAHDKLSSENQEATLAGVFTFILGERYWLTIGGAMDFCLTSVHNRQPGPDVDTNQ